MYCMTSMCLSQNLSLLNHFIYLIEWDWMYCLMSFIFYRCYFHLVFQRLLYSTKICFRFAPYWFATQTILKQFFQKNCTKLWTFSSKYYAAVYLNACYEIKLVIEFWKSQLWIVPQSKSFEFGKLHFLNLIVWIQWLIKSTCQLLW